MKNKDRVNVDDNKFPTATLTNAERLRAHLTPNGLAAMLLSAWEKEDTAAVQERLLAALKNFYIPEQISNDEAKTE